MLIHLRKKRLRDERSGRPFVSIRRFGIVNITNVTEYINTYIYSYGSLLNKLIKVLDLAPPVFFFFFSL